MQVLANAKINLGLNVLSKRDDGFHNIESCFIPIPLYDKITLTPSDANRFTSSGIAIPEDEKGNLCMQALKELQQKFNIGYWHIHLEKNIPIGAGLGGGSSDAVAVLKGLNQACSLGITEIELEKLALKLGSDCPFFVANRVAYVLGRGEELSPIENFKLQCNLLLVYPAMHVSTKTAYANIQLNQRAESLSNLAQWNKLDWKEKVSNSFESTVFAQHPELAKIKEKFYKTGAFYASMSGSGSSLFGFYEEECPHLDWPDNYQVFQLSISI